jgi:hypothetical protein
MRRTLVAFVGTLLVLANLPSRAQTNEFVGQWRGTTAVNGVPVTVSLVMGPDQSYSHQMQMGPYMTLQTGQYALTGPNILTFNVVDWEPKTQPIYHPTGTVGGYYTYEPTGKPPGGTYAFQFNAPGSMTLRDVNFGGTITFVRVQ